MRPALKSFLFGAAALAALPGAAHAAWTKTYAVEWNEPAMYYGAKSGVTDPGTDCPRGTNPEVDWVKVLVEAGYSPAEAKWLRDPANPTRSPINGQNQMAFRGKDRANVYINPTSTPESGQFLPVSGDIGEGVDLDGDTKNGFTSPTGVTGIDNNFYRALGCWKTYRAPPRLSSGALQFNDSMREGGWTTVIVVSGKGKDPLNDNDVTVGFYVSPDKLIKNGAGGISADYTFRIKPDRKYEALFKAKTVKGHIVSTAASDEVWMRDPSYSRDLQLLKAKVDLTMQKDGTLKGYVGGYRPWQTVYNGWVGARGPVIESLTWVRLPDVYYALKKYADYAPTPGGEKTHISFALRVDAIPAFVMKPDASSQVASVVSYKAEAPTAVAVAAPPAALGGVIDGIVVGRGGKAVSQTADQLKPPPGYAAQDVAKPVATNSTTASGT